MLDERKWERGMPLPEPPLSRKNNTSKNLAVTMTTTTRTLSETVSSTTTTSSMATAINNTRTPRTTPWNGPGKTTRMDPLSKSSGVATATTAVASAARPLIPPAPKENPWGNKTHKPATLVTANSNNNTAMQPFSPPATHLPATTTTRETNRSEIAPVPSKVSPWGRQPHLVARGENRGNMIPPAASKTSTDLHASGEKSTDITSSFPPLGTVPEPKIRITERQEQSTSSRARNPAAVAENPPPKQSQTILQQRHPRSNSSGNNFTWAAKEGTTNPPTLTTTTATEESFPALGSAAPTLSGFPALSDTVRSSVAVQDGDRAVVGSNSQRRPPTSLLLLSSSSQPQRQRKRVDDAIQKGDKTSTKKKKSPQSRTTTTSSVPVKSTGVDVSKKTKKVGDEHHSTGTVSLGLINTATAPSDHRIGVDLSVLQRMMINNRGEIKKGRQRLKPRKKKFTSLKKKVLEERLRKWKELHPNEAVKNSTKNTSDEMSVPVTTTVCLYGFSNDPDEREDDDEYDEIVENLRDMANKVGMTRRVFVPRNGDTDAVAVFVDFGTTEDAIAAVACWNGLVLGGQELQCRLITNTTTEASSTANDSEHLAGDKETEKSDEEWQDWCMKNEPTNLANTLPRTTDVYLDNALAEDDLEDEECMEESLDDIRALASKFGEVDRIDVVEPTERNPPCVRITYIGDEDTARNAAAELSRLVIGGQAVSARLTHSSDQGDSSDTADDRCILLRNVLTEDDLEDEECLEESINDLQELAQEFGTVQSAVLDTGMSSSDGDNAVRIVFSTADEARIALSGFDGMVVGGLTVSAILLSNGQDPEHSKNAESSQQKVEDEKKPLYSGDKIISERFAECKRVPKIVTSVGPRPYATLATDESVKPLLVEMLGELMRLQQRAAEEKNAKARRRVVLGLREVARGIRSRKVKLVVMANNLDEYGAIDEKVQTIIDSAHEADVPVFYEFSKRTLGKALGKNLKIGVAGVQNADGAHQQFKKLIKIASLTG